MVSDPIPKKRGQAKMKLHNVIEVNESASLHIRTISGCDPQPANGLKEEALVEDAIIWYFDQGDDCYVSPDQISVHPHYYGAYRAVWTNDEGEEVEKYFVVEYLDEDEDEA